MPYVRHLYIIYSTTYLLSFERLPGVIVGERMKEGLHERKGLNKRKVKKRLLRGIYLS